MYDATTPRQLGGKGTLGLSHPIVFGCQLPSEFECCRNDIMGLDRGPGDAALLGHF